MQFNEAKQIAIRYLGISKKTEYEVIKKLKGVKVPPLVIDSVIDYLKELDYINDEKYVNLYYTTCQRAKKYFTFEIKQKLLQKGIKACIIEEKESCFLQENTDYNDIVKDKLVLSKLKDYDERKTNEYLYRRGYTR